MLQTFHYLRGNKVSFDLKKELSDLGFKIKETIIYKQKNNKLSDKQKAISRVEKLEELFSSQHLLQKFFAKISKLFPMGFCFFV